MYNERPEDIIRRHKSRISLEQIFASIIIIMLTFVLPVQVFEVVKNQEPEISPYSINAEPSNGRVAGAYTQADGVVGTIDNLLAGQETQVLIIIGVSLMLLGVGIVIYLATSKKEHNYPKPSPDFILE